MKRSDMFSLIGRCFEFVFGSQARAGLLQIILCSPFMLMAWSYRRFKQRVFKANPMELYATMITKIELDEWFINAMKRKGWTHEEEVAYRKRAGY